MNKMMVIVFNDETTAFEGLNALKELHGNGDISLYATAVISKQENGEVETLQKADDGPVGAAVGMLTGSLLGILAGPHGLALGASLGGLTGLIFDMDKSDIDMRFIDDVSAALSPGKVAVLADVEESWMTPIDTRISDLDGLVFRRLRSEVAEDQIIRESEAFHAELDHLRKELKEANEENKQAIEKQIADSREKLKIMSEQLDLRIDSIENEYQARMEKLKDQYQEAKERRKNKVEMKIAELKGKHDQRKQKLQNCREMIMASSELTSKSVEPVS